MLFQCFQRRFQISLKKINRAEEIFRRTRLWGSTAAHPTNLPSPKETLSGGIPYRARSSKKTRVIWRFQKSRRKCVARFQPSLPDAQAPCAQVVELRRLRRAFRLLPAPFSSHLFLGIERLRDGQRIFCLWDLLSDRPGCNQAKSNAARLVVRRGFTRQASETARSVQLLVRAHFFSNSERSTRTIFRAPGR